MAGEKGRSCEASLSMGIYRFTNRLVASAAPRVGVEGGGEGRGEGCKGEEGGGEGKGGREIGREKEGVVARINGCQLLSHFSDYA